MAPHATGARTSLSASHVFFLNPDAILAEGAVPEIEKAIRRYPGAGGFGPAIATPDKRQRFRSTSYPQYQGRPKEGDAPPTDTVEVDFLDGAALVCDLELFLKIGGFDEGLFLYYEDDDLCFRTRSQNRKLIYVATANVMHNRNKSSRNGIYLEYFRSYHAARSRISISNKYNLPLDARRERKASYIRSLEINCCLERKKGREVLGYANCIAFE